MSEPRVGLRITTQGAMLPGHPLKRTHRNDGLSGLGAKGFVEGAALVRSAVSALGITIHPSSRIARQLNDAAAVGDFLLDNTKVLRTSRTLHYSICEFGDLIVIAEQLRKKDEDPGIVALLARLASDDSSPHVGSETPGRDVQFELYCAAVCRRARFSVRSAEPDLVVVPLVGHAANLGQIGVAVKRVKSLGQLPKRISEGGKQLASSKPGIVIVDISMLLNREDSFFMINPGAEGIDQVAHIVDSYVNAQISSFITHVNRRSTVGIIFQAKLFTAYSMSDGTPWPGSIGRWYGLPIDPRYEHPVVDFVMRLAFPDGPLPGVGTIAKEGLIQPWKGGGLYADLMKAQGQMPKADL